MARKSLVGTVVCIAAFAVPNAFADKGGIPHPGSSGQGRPVTQQQTAATAPQGKALAKGHAKTHAASPATTKSHPAGRALAKGHAKSQVVTNTTPPGPPATNTHAKAGKTTLCHATGSATNPYVEITISNNAIPAHQRHQDGRDIIPAPAGGCPSTSTGQQPGEVPQTPGSVQQEQSLAAPTTGASTTGVTPAAGVLGSTTSGSPGAPSKIHVLGATTSGRAPSASTSPAATATRPASSSGLPFTGTDAIIVAILGLAALLLGVTARRVAATKSKA
jgi:hypothetical protein